MQNNKYTSDFYEDNLIMSFSQKQINKYFSIKKKLDLGEKIELPNIEPQSPISPFDKAPLKENIEKIICEAIKLLDLKDVATSFFKSSKLTNTEKELYRAKYYEVINNINELKSQLFPILLEYKKSYDKHIKTILSIDAQYAEFLSYKAALHNEEKYEKQIKQIESVLKESKEGSLSEAALTYHIYASVSIIYEDCINGFFKNSLSASGAPSFDAFNSNAFFEVTEAFCARVRLQLSSIMNPPSTEELLDKYFEI